MQAQEDRRDAAPRFRLDVPLHDLLMKTDQAPRVAGESDLAGLPEPVFPQRPKLLHVPPGFPGRHVPPARRYWTPRQIYGAMRGWLFPFVRSRTLPGDFHPIIAYLFTEYKCNLDCHTAGPMIIGSKG
jgi:hypothetical protein